MKYKNNEDVHIIKYKEQMPSSLTNFWPFMFSEKYFPCGIKIFNSWICRLISLMNKKALSKKALRKYLNTLTLFGWEISEIQKLLVITYNY